jgi:hypothetical protein
MKRLVNVLVGGAACLFVLSPAAAKDEPKWVTAAVNEGRHVLLDVNSIIGRHREGDPIPTPPVLTVWFQDMILLGRIRYMNRVEINCHDYAETALAQHRYSYDYKLKREMLDHTWTGRELHYYEPGSLDQKKVEFACSVAGYADGSSAQRVE